MVADGSLALCLPMVFSLCDSVFQCSCKENSKMEVFDAHRPFMK